MATNTSERVRRSFSNDFGWWVVACERQRMKKWLPLMDTFRTFYLFPTSKTMRLIVRYRSLRSDVG